MITSASTNRELKRTSGSNQILLTLKKYPAGSCMNAVIKRIIPSRDIKLLNLNGNSQSHSLSLKDVDSLTEPESIDVKVPKITQICTNKMSPAILNTQHTSLSKDTLLTEKNFLQKCTSLLNGHQISRRLVKTPKKTKLEYSNHENSESNFNKNNRFVPNILRSTKTGEESSSNNLASIGFWPLLATRMKSNKERNAVKRKRKQVLKSDEPESSSSQRNQTVQRKNELDQSLKNILDRRCSAEESGSSTIGFDVSNGKNENVNQALEPCSEILQTGEEEPATESLDHNDSNELKTEISQPSQLLDESVCTDKSVQKILDEFKEPDYKNYIIPEDFCFDEIDEMEKLLSSNNDNDSLKESSLLNDSAKIVEYDVNGNDIENCGNATEMNSDANEWQTSNVRYRSNKEGAKSIDDARNAKLDINLDEICSNGPNQGKNLIIPPRTELWTDEFENYFYPGGYLDEFQSNVKQISLLGTASEFEENEFGCMKSANFILEEKDLDYSTASLAAVSDVMPDNVFSYGSNEENFKGFECEKDATKQLLDLGLATAQNKIDSSDKIDCSLNESVEKFTNNFQLINHLEENLEFMEVDNFSFNGDVLNENEIYEKRTEDRAEISEHFESGDNFVNDCQFPLNVRLVSRELNAFENKSSLDLNSRFNMSGTSCSDPDSLPFTDDEIDDTADNNSQVAYDPESKGLHMSEDEKFSCESEAETNELECRLSENRISNLFSSNNLIPRYANCMDSCSRCAPPFIMKRNLDKLEISELEAMLARKKRLEDYSHTYLAPSVAHNVTSDSKMADNFDKNLYWQVKGCSQAIWRSKEFGYRNVEQTSHIGHLPRETDISSQDSTNISNYNTLRSARNNHWLDLNSPCDEASLDCQLYSYQMSSGESRATDNLPTVINKSNQGNRKKRNEKKTEENITFVHCGCCKKKYATTQELTEHIRAVHNNETRPFINERKKYVCGKCSKEYCFPGAIEKHLKLHENYSLTCRKCGQHFSERRFLTFHVYHYHLNRRFECRYCKKKFARRNDHTRHLKECCGNDERWLKCNI